jgi:hypothetical protein
MRIRRNILLGRDEDHQRPPGRTLGADGACGPGAEQMVVRPVAGFLHIVVYAGFVIINIEVLEIIIDGIFGTHRVLSFLGGFYDFLIGSFEWLAVAPGWPAPSSSCAATCIKHERFVDEGNDRLAAPTPT